MHLYNQILVFQSTSPKRHDYSHLNDENQLKKKIKLKFDPSNKTFN